MSQTHKLVMCHYLNTFYTVTPQLTSLHHKTQLHPNIISTVHSAIGNKTFFTLLVSKDSERNILPISNLLLIALLDSIGLFCSLWLETSKRKEKCTASCAFFRYLPGMPHHHLLVPPLPMTQQCLPKYRESSSRISIISDELR